MSAMSSDPCHELRKIALKCSEDHPDSNERKRVCKEGEAHHPKPPRG